MEKKNTGRFPIFSDVFSPLFYLACAMLLVAIIMTCIVCGISGKEATKEELRISIISSQTFHNGITVEGVEIGGLTYAQALDALAPVEEQLKQQINYSLSYNGKEYVVDAKAFNVSFDTKEVLDTALQLARNGGLLKLQNSLNSFENAGKSYEINFSLDATPLRAEIERISSEIYVAPVNATAAIDPNLKDINYNTVVSGYPFVFTEAKDGLKVDTDLLYAAIMNMVAEKKFGAVEVPTLAVKPEIDIVTMKANVFLRSYFSTSYAKGNGYNRVFNIQKASDMICGTVIQPGENFSTEGIIGRRTKEAGWLEAGAVIAGGADTELQYGGGVCQVSTTVYNAVVKADLQIVHRQNHSKASTYVDPGLDATINTDTIDFIWKNNTDYPVYVFTWLNRAKETIYCAIYAQKFPAAYDRIDFASTFIKKIDPTETVYTEHSSLKDGEWMLKNKAITGYVYESYAYYYDGSQLVDTKFVATSSYRMHPARYYVYPGYVIGNALDPYKEMIKDASGKWVRKYSHTPAPTPEDTPTPTPTPDWGSNDN